MQAGGTLNYLNRQSINVVGDFSNRNRSYNDPTLPREIEVDPKIASLYWSIYEIYNNLKTCTIDEISKSMGVDPVSILEKEKKPVEIEALVNGMKYFVNRMIKYNVALKEINDKKKDRNTLTFGSEELLPMLEADLKTSLREQEKLKLLLETAHIKIKHIEKKNEELIAQTKKMSQEVQNEKNRFKTQLKNQGEQLKFLQEENIIIRRPTTGNSSVKKLKEIKGYRDNFNSKGEFIEERGTFQAIQTSKSANSLMFDNVKQIAAHMDQNKLHNLQTKHELKEFRRKAEQEREKELTTKQKDLLISRLNIQVDEREKDITRLKNDYDRVFQELKKMKEKESEREREEWTKEVLSDKNPNTVASYKKKLEERDATISLLKKQLRKYAISEKKVFIKEKAFELERAEYQDRMIYLQDRVNKLGKINDDLKRTNNDGISRDRFRKKRETNLNKSQTSSEDNTEVRHGSGLASNNLETLGTIPDSYGKTPKVAFEGKLTSGRNPKFF